MEAVRISPLFAMGISELLIILLFALIVLYPWAIILEKAGRASSWLFWCSYLSVFSYFPGISH